MRTGTLHKLKAAQVRAAGDGMHSDGGGLFLRVSGAARSWVFRHTSAGRKREMGLGPAANVSLAWARELAAEARDTVAAGADPIASRKAASALASPRTVPSFRDAVDRHIRDNAPTWSNRKSSAQWRASLEAYAAPILELPVDRIDVADIEACVAPIWLTKSETASRVRGASSGS